MNIFILSGAGLSAESGIPTFRDANGLWEDSEIEDVATPSAFDRDPAQVHSFYNHLRNKYRDVRPLSAHFALAELQKSYAGEIIMVTQNIDDILEQAGCEGVIHIHGELYKCRCIYCRNIMEWRERTSTSLRCPICGECGAWGSLRPHIVWFSEVPFYLPEINNYLQQCDLFLAVGTSGVVYPAAGFAKSAKEYGAKTVCVNLESPQNGSEFDEIIIGTAGKMLSEWLNNL